MNTKNALAALLALLAVSTVPHARAANVYWDGSDGAWDSGTSWRTADNGGGSLIGSGTPLAADYSKVSSGLVSASTAPGIVSSQQVHIGQAAANSGTLQVNGYFRANTVIILGNGADSNGVLEILGTGTARVGTNFAIANAARTTGTVFVRDGGYIYVAGGSAYVGVGNGSSGYLEIARSGSLLVDGRNLTIGKGAGSSGILVNSGSIRTGAGALLVGELGRGTLDIRDTGAVISADGIIGQGAAASGTAFVAGLWNNSGALTVGGAGDGHLEVRAHGSVASAGVISLGTSAGGSGIIEVARDASITGKSTLLIGVRGDGYLHVAEGGAISNTGAGALGRYTTASTGSAFIEGAWIGGAQIFVGYEGSGHLEIASTGTVVNSGILYIGSSANSNGAAIVNGHWTSGTAITAHAYVGNNGTGFLDVGGSVAVGGQFFVANGAASTGTTIVRDGGAIANVREFVVGQSGNGYLKVEQGGGIHAGFAITGADARATYIGNNPTATGTAFVDGLFHADANLEVGRNGTGFLDIGVTGTVISNQSVSIGTDQNGGGTANGTVRVAGFLSGSNVYGGGWYHRGASSLTILGTGTVRATAAFDSNSPASTLTIVVDPARDTPYIVSEGNAILGGSLIVDGLDPVGGGSAGAKASEILSRSVLIMRADTGITGEFASITTGGGGGSLGGHIAFGGSIVPGPGGSADYRVGHILAWNADAAIAHGTFDIADGQTFDLDIPLANRPDGFAAAGGWDGRSLTKNGTGTLILSAENTFTGAVTINAGDLRLNGTRDARLGPLDLNGGALDFGGPAGHVIGGRPGQLLTPALDGYRVLTVDSLAGTGGEFRMKIDLSAGKSDRLIILGNATGSHRLMLAPAAGSAIPHGDESRLTLVTFGGAVDADFETAGFEGSYDQGAFRYALQRQDNRIVIAPAGLSAAAAPIRGIPGAQSAMWFSQQDNLGHRLGELRSGSLELGDLWLGNRWNLWMRARAAGAAIDAGDGAPASDLTLWGAELGADKTWRLTDEKITLGFYAGYGAGAQDLDIAGADGGSTLVGAGAYAAWLNDRGWFANLTLSAASYKNTFDAPDLSGNPSSASYRDTAYGAAIEAGRRIVLDLGDGKAGGYFLEPSAQLFRLRLDRADYTVAATAPFNVHSSAASITRTRLALRGGRAWRPGEHGRGGFLEIAGRLAATHETSSGGEVRVGAESWRPNLDGTRFEAGAGVIWQPGVDNQFHFDYEAAAGDNYTKPWEFSIAIRHMF